MEAAVKNNNMAVIGWCMFITIFKIVVGKMRVIFLIDIQEAC